MKKTLNIVKNILVWLIVIIAVAVMIFTIVSVNTFDRSDRSLFGYKINVVLSDSMSAVKDDPDHKGYFNAGDLVFSKEVDPSTLKKGDIVTYTSTNSENYGATVTHMIRECVVDTNGEPGFITYGTTTNTDDANIVTYSYVLGKYEGRLPFVGRFFMFLQTTPGYIVCILLPFLLLIGMQGFNSIRLFKKYKEEQLAEIEAQRQKERDELQAEREAMEAERKRQEEMLQKLLEMQAAIQGDATKTQAPTEEDNSSET